MSVASKKLAQILNSSFFISRYANQELSIPAISLDLYKIEEVYENEWEKNLVEFDGYGLEEIESKAFQMRHHKLKEKLGNLLTSYRYDASQPIIKKLDENKIEYRIADNFTQKIEHPITEKWYKKYTQMGGNKCFEFQEKDLEESRKRLIEIARYNIKLEAMQHISDEIYLEGTYHYSQKFDTVADACRWLSSKIEKPTREKYLNEIRSDRIIIEKNGKELTNPDTLYNHTYSWWQNQVEQGDEIPKK